MRKTPRQHEENMSAPYNKSTIVTILIPVVILLLSGAAIHAAGTLEANGAYQGTESEERVGYCLSGVGDINGDGYDDFAIGNFHTARFDFGYRKDCGAVYLVLGKEVNSYFDISLETADARFTGSRSYDAVGYAVGSQGDINGDGFDDLLIGACAGNDLVSDKPGYAYIMFGKADVDWGYTYQLYSNADVKFNGENGQDLTGLSLDIIGDMNGDGYDEFIIAAPFNDQGKTDGGKVYFFKGKASWSSSISLVDADASFVGHHNYGAAGYSVSRLGDVNGDNIPDFAIGERGPGNINIIFGRTNPNWGKDVPLTDADVILDEEKSSDVGWKVAPAGDVNNDGYDDILIAAPMYHSERGKVYLVLGRQTSAWFDMNLALADASFLGEASGDNAGWSIGGNFDFDYDGYADFLIGAWKNDQNGDDVGKGYIIYGKDIVYESDVRLSTIPDYFTGQHAGDYAGFAVSNTGDFDNDGVDDFILSATYYSKYIHWGGLVYLFLSDVELSKISGQAYHFKSGLPLDSVYVSELNDTLAIQTDLTGDYLFHFKQNRDYLIVPTKSGKVLSGSDVITAYDAALTARYALQMDPYDEYLEYAPDVDGDGIITTFDAASILRFAIELPAPSGTYTGEWRFEPASRTYSNLADDYLDQDFRGFIAGDADGNWSQDSTSQFKVAGQQVKASYTAHTTNDTLYIDFLSNANLNVCALNIDLSYMESAISFCGIDKSPLLKNFILMSNHTDCRLHIGAYSTESMDQQGRLLTVKFFIQESDVTPEIELDRFLLNQVAIETEQVVTSSTEQTSVAKSFVVYHNYPNPFNLSTTIAYSLNADSYVKIDIYNQTGAFVMTLQNGILESGGHRCSWNGTDEYGNIVASGIYFVRFKINDSVQNYKMILQK